jgi:sugar lactone lactonase YvrE
MSVKRTSVLCILFFLCSIAFSACSQKLSPAGLLPTSTAGKAHITPTFSPPLKTTSTPDTTPTHYKARLLLSGRYRPDDLVFDPAGHLLFSDVYRGTISRLNANGSVTQLISGLAGPEGLVFLPNGTLVIAEQRTNRVLAYSPQTGSLSVLRVLPGVPTGQPCKDGVDGIALDPLTQTLIIPDSPIGTVYRMSLDGKKLVLLAAHIPRPVGAAVDVRGNIYVADECGGALWEITPAGKLTRMGGFGMLDDVAFDHHGNVLVTDLKPSIHALIRVRLPDGNREVLASQGFIEPQGLAVDSSDNIYVSDDYADKIVEYEPTSGS